jgi:hypothetical protein
MPTESKLQRFERLAERRVAEVIKKVRLIANLSNRNNYAFSEKHVRQMFTAIEREVKLAKERFVPHGSSKDPSFTFHKTDEEQ